MGYGICQGKELRSQKQELSNYQENVTLFWDGVYFILLRFGYQKKGKSPNLGGLTVLQKSPTSLLAYCLATFQSILPHSILSELSKTQIWLSLPWPETFQWVLTVQWYSLNYKYVTRSIRPSWVGSAYHSSLFSHMMLFFLESLTWHT